MKRCPYCAEEIQDEAVKCKHCGENLTGHSTDTLDKAFTVQSKKDEPQYDTLDAAATQGKEATILANQYRIVKKIGEGGMGVVYLAYDIEMRDRQVAIKVLPPVLARNRRAIENLRDEAITAIKLNHPDIVRLYGFHSDGEIKFLVMEYIDGQTLEEKIFNSPLRKLNPEETINIAQEVAVALDYAHSRKPPVFHRDLKPSNIMINKDGDVKLLDFGIAREMKDSYTRVTGQETSGTLPYMSPQQLMGARPDASMDIYSLGAVLYECFSGHTPFYTGDLRRQIEVKPVDNIADLPDEINAALQKALAKDSGIRPKTADELIRMLKTKPQPKVEPEQEEPPIKQEPKRSEPIETQVFTQPEPVGKETKNRKGLWFVLTLVVIGIIIAAINQSGQRKTTTNRPANPNAGDVITNSIGMKLIHIPAGEFMMGSPSDEKDRQNDEGPQHKVKISKSFYMGVYEVTQKQYKAVMGNNPSNFKGDNLPVENVSWDDTVEFCRKLSQKEGKTYRLPTEAEWEYACRAGTTTRFSFGDSDSGLDGYAWYSNNSGSKTHPVGQKNPNAFGLYDMHGNVWEWCQDWYGRSYYSNSPAVDPQGPDSGKARMLCGGSWGYNPWFCRSASRDWSSPDYRSSNLGFRVALDF